MKVACSIVLQQNGDQTAKHEKYSFGELSRFYELAVEGLRQRLTVRLSSGGARMIIEDVEDVAVSGEQASVDQRKVEKARTM